MAHTETEKNDPVTDMIYNVAGVSSVALGVAYLNEPIREKLISLAEVIRVYFELTRALSLPDELAAVAVIGMGIWILSQTNYATDVKEYIKAKTDNRNNNNGE